MTKHYNNFFVRQHGEFSCGLACLAMVVKYHGGNARQEDLRAISGTNLQGTTLLGLYQAAQKLNFNPEAYEADFENLAKIETPVILHVIKENRLEHYIVCFGFDGMKFLIADPAETGIKSLMENELAEIWKSKALLMLTPNENFVKQTDEKREKYQWLKKIVREDFPLLSVAFILGVIIAALGLATAIFSQRLIDDLLPTRNFEKIILGICLFCMILLARSGLDYLRSVFMLRQARGFNNRLINTFFSKILYLPKSFFDATKTGEIIARMNDSRRIQQTLSYIVGSVLIEVIILLFSIIYLLIYSWEMALIATACIPLFALLVLFYNRKIVEGQRNVMVSYAAVEGQLIDFMKGVDEIKIANRQNLFKQAISGIYSVFQEFSYRLGMLGNKFGIIAQIISVIINVSIIIFGVWLVLNGHLTLGELMAVISIGGMIIGSTANLSSVNIRLQEAGVAFDRFYEFFKTKPEFEQSEQPAERKYNDIHLEIKNLSFRFAGRKKLFDSVSLKVQKGELVVILGEIGIGKSTLIQILMKNYPYESGEIYINNANFSDISIPEWRENIGVVSQQTKTFNGTVGENICLGNYLEKRSDVLTFCQEYGFDRFFETFPNGIDTLLGEDGINISGGQRQLIALARALYRKPSLLLLDEPTAAMDTKTEQFVINLLQERKSRFATIMVTHRTYLSEWADSVYVLESGTVR
jgi:ATP-binding cassette subfamily B protein